MQANAHTQGLKNKKQTNKNTKQLTLLVRIAIIDIVFNLKLFILYFFSSLTP